jgi:hypothetical protein
MVQKSMLKMNDSGPYLVREFLIYTVFKVFRSDLVVCKSMRRDLDEVIEFGLR